MTITIIQLPNEPILHCLLTGTITDADVEAMLDACAGRVAELTGPIFRITEAQDTRITFSDIVLMLDTITRYGRRAETQRGPQIIDVLVGRDEVVELIAESVQQTQYGRQQIPLFDDLGAALTYVRARVKAMHAA